MATEKLYYQDAHQAAFEARVVSCQPGKHGYDVVLDRTCFYPEGGGQPGDTGFLSGVRVTDTQYRKSTRLNSSHKVQSRMPSSA